MTVASVLEEVKQTLKEDSSPLPAAFVADLNEALKGTQAHAVIGGSWAKNTYLAGDHDIDVFVRYPPTTSDGQMAATLLKALTALGSPKTIRGSRDYYQLDKGHFTFEIVPVLNVTKVAQARNITDMSPLHVDYVREHSKRQPDLQGQIRLAKLFCKAAKMYGAESYINGISGHVLDLLLIHYGSCEKFLRAAAEWNAPVYIDPTGKHADPDYLDKDKRQGPLVVIDPVQDGRNAAAALKEEAFDTLKEQARLFLERPSPDYFTLKPLTIQRIKEHCKDEPHLILSLSAVPGASKDIRGTKLYRVHKTLIAAAKNTGFTVTEQGFEFDGRHALAYICVGEEPLDREVLLVGPPSLQRSHAEKFRDAHPQAFEREGRLYAHSTRTILTLKELSDHILGLEYVKKRFEKAKII